MLRQTYFVLLVALALVPASAAHAQTFDTGAITGRVVDGRSGDPILGATVAVSGSGLNGSLSAITDGNGEYFVTALPPGVYSVSVYYGDWNTHRPNVVVSAGATTRVDAALAKPARTSRSETPSIRHGHRSLGALLTWEYYRNIPLRSRVYEGSTGVAPGAAGDDLGIGFGGSQSLENAYVIDGLDTTGVTYGVGGAPVRLEFLQAVDVLTSGFDAESGRAMGGLIRVVTKSGTNRLRGSVFGAWRPFEAEREGIAEQGAAIVGKTTLIGEGDLGFDLGGPIIVDRAWFYVGFAPSVTQQTVTRIVGTRVDRRINGGGLAPDDGDGDPRTSPDYGCELQPAPGGLLTQCEADGIADVDPDTGYTIFEEIERTHATQHSARYEFIGKITAAPGEGGNHQAFAQILGTPSSGRGIGVNGTPQASQYDFDTLALNVVGGWTSRLMGSRLELSALAGWHRFSETTAPIDPALQDEPRIQFDRISLGMVGRNPDQPESAPVLDLCTDDDRTTHDYFPRITNCPVIGYGINSLGGVTDKREDRLIGQLAAKYRWRWSGQHTARAGVQLENDQLHDFGGVTGGVLFRLRSARDYWREFRYARFDDAGPDLCGFYQDGSPRLCELLDRLRRSTEAVRWAAFVDDEWLVLPGLTFYGGLRLEQQRLKIAKELGAPIDPATGEPIDDTPVSLTAISPRLGFEYDWTREGRARLFGTWGRYHESIPLDLANRAFGGESFYEQFYDARDPTTCAPWADEGPDRTPRVPSDPRTCGRDQFAPSPPFTYPPSELPPGISSLVMPGLQPPYVDELVLGVEHEIDRHTLVGVAFQHRRLGEAIEDVSTDGANTYVIANPGADLPDSARAQLEADIAGEVDPFKRGILERRLAMFQAISGIDRAHRQTTSLQIRVHHRFRGGFAAHVSYTYSSTTGNYGGLYGADNGQLDPNITSQYDLVELLANRAGPLPQDRPHNLKLDGYYRFDLNAGRAESVTVGVRWRAVSGTPVNTLGSHAYYGPNESFILPRGSGGRTEFLTGTDLRVIYERAAGRSARVSLFLDVYNVFNSQGETDVDQMYTSDEVNPIVGGDQGDLRHLKNHDFGNGTAAIAQPELSYGRTNRRAAPLAARVGFRVEF